DRDFVLNWQPNQARSRPALQVISHEDLGEGMRYFLALITPPAETDEWPGVDREVLLLVDRSGSMSGRNGTRAAGRCGASWPACRNRRRSTLACSSRTPSGWS